MSLPHTIHPDFSDGWTNDYIDIPFLDRGRTRDGLDCWGLVWLVYSEKLGIELPNLSGRYESASDRDKANELVAEERVGSVWSFVEVPIVGDVALLNILGNDSHIGIAINSRQMLHIMQGANCCIQDLTRPSWSRRLSGFCRHWSRGPMLSES